MRLRRSGGKKFVQNEKYDGRGGVYEVTGSNLHYYATIVSEGFHCGNNEDGDGAAVM